MRLIFLNKSKLGKWISSFRRLKESKAQIIKLTITEDKIIPTTPKLYGERFPKFLIGAPTKNQSKKILNIIPVSYTHLRAHETGRNLVCRLLLEKKKKK